MNDYPELAPLGAAIEVGDTSWIDAVLSVGSVLSLLAGYVALIYAVVSIAKP